jgi:hypothetical protein
MNLIKTIDEVKAAFSNIDKDYNINSLKSFIDDAEKNILVNWIGQAFYDVMLTAYNNPDIAGKKAQLVPYLQKAIAHLALWKSADSGSFRINDAGFYVTVTATNKPVSDKKLEKFELGRREDGYRGLEQAIAFLEANIGEADFEAYANSDERLNNKANFINNAADFTRYYTMMDYSAYMFFKLRVSVGFCERKFINPVLGNGFAETLKANLIDNTLTADQRKLMPYIKRALANYSIAYGASSIGLQFDGSGIIVQSQPSTGTFDVGVMKTAATSAQLNPIIKDALSMAQTELRSLEDYLISNAGSLPGYVLPTDTGDDLDVNDPDAPTYFV